MDDNDPLGAYGLNKIELHHKSLFDTFFSLTHPQLSDYTFANTFIWRDSIHIRWRLLDDCLCVFANGDGGLSLLFPPIGEGNFQTALSKAMEICRDFNAQAHIEQQPRVEYISETLLPYIPGGAVVEPMSGDYVYSTRKMIDLDGGELASKRSGRNRFARENNIRCETFSEQHLDQCLALLGLWQVQSESSPSSTITSVRIKRAKEISATASSLENAKALGLTGMVLYANDKLVGFTLGELLHDGQTCSIVIEKTDRNHRGSANYIFNQFCRAYWAHTSWCNAGDDWEVPSLAWTKQSYRPAFRLDKWVVWPAAPVQLAVPYVPAPREERVAEIVPQTAARLAHAKLADLNQLLLLESRCFDSKEAFNRRQLRYLLRCPLATTLIIRHNEQVVAAAVLLRRRMPKGMNARVHSIAVEPAHQKQGFGRLLLKRCLSILQTEGISSVYLEVAENNSPAISLYESMGFIKVRRLPDYYGLGRHAWKMHARIAPDSLLTEQPVATAAVTALPELCL